MREPSERVVVITGADGGLGVAVTQAFLDAGARVVGVSRSVPLVPAPEGRLFSVVADLTAPGRADRVIAAVQERYGRVDVLLHLVGGFEGGVTVQETSNDIWQRMLDVNLNAAFFTIRAALRAMPAAGGGRIVAIGTRTALEPAATLGAYGASKAALVSLIRTLALELRGSGNTANIILPSVIDTPANRATNPAADPSRWVKPASIARLLLWLASDASADVNGAVIPIYGRV